MIFTFENARFENNCLVLPISNKPLARQFVLEQKKDKAYQVEIKPYSEKRSLNANAYCWVLCEKLAKAINSTKEEVYCDAICDVGVFRDFHLHENEVPTFRHAWESLGTGWPTQIVDYGFGGVQIVRAYYGSSTYTVKRMTRLIDNLVQDCKAVGIEVIPEEELQSLLNTWQPKGV